MPIHVRMCPLNAISGFYTFLLFPIVLLYIPYSVPIMFLRDPGSNYVCIPGFRVREVNVRARRSNCSSLP